MGKRNVIILEDEEIFLLHLKELLGKLGCRILASYSSGDELLEDLDNHNPDLLLMDIMVSGSIDGIETAKRVKDKMDVPVVFISAYSGTKLVSRVKKVKPAGYLVKPIVESDLKTCIELVLQQHQDRKVEVEQRSLEISGLMSEKEGLIKSNTEILRNVEELSSTNEHLITATFREREMKQKLSATLDELEVTKGYLEHQNNRIRESISYAETIQGSILPDTALVRKTFPESFIYYIPKDVVSGDFPWFYKKGDDIYIAAVDCTGHGVPGSMLSFIGYFLLNEITGHRAVLSPAEVLENLHSGVVKTLRQDQEGCKNVRDGMDIALCKINLKTMELEYSGAHRPLYLIQDGELSQVKGDKHPIGGIHWKKKRKLVPAGITEIESNGSAGALSTSSSSSGNHSRQFTNHKIKIKKGDSVFFFSDGFPDQFGGDEGLKYGPKRIRETLLANNRLSMTQIHDLFKKDFEKWMESSKQIDDVLMIGIGF